jgi:hypothetical protein
MSELSSAPPPSLRATGPWDFHRFFPAPLPGAIQAGVFRSGTDTGNPSAEEVVSIHQEHVSEMLANLNSICTINQRLRDGEHPVTGKKLTKRSAPFDAKALIRSHWREHRQLLSAYQEGFGPAARRALDLHAVSTMLGTLIVETGTEELETPDDINHEPDAQRRAAKTIAFFDANCPAVWKPGNRVWNVDKAGRYRAYRSPRQQYTPEHPYFYHTGGSPTPPATLMAEALPLDAAAFKQALQNEAKNLDGDALLDSHRSLLCDVLGKYTALLEKGPIALPESAKTFQRFGKTPMTLWAEAMSMLYRQSRSKALLVKALQEVREQRAKPKVGVCGQLELFP